MRFVDYKCNDCNNICEIVITSDNGKEIECESCGSRNMVRVFAPIGFKSSSKGGEFEQSASSGKSCSGGSCGGCSGCR